MEILNENCFRPFCWQLVYFSTTIIQLHFLFFQISRWIYFHLFINYNVNHNIHFIETKLQYLWIVTFCNTWTSISESVFLISFERLFVLFLFVFLCFISFSSHNSYHFHISDIYLLFLDYFHLFSCFLLILYILISIIFIIIYKSIIWCYWEYFWQNINSSFLQ